jgi:hypothetical protein
LLLKKPDFKKHINSWRKRARIDYTGLKVIASGKVEQAIEDKRWNHCKGCTYLTEKNRCKKCGCFMKLKVKFKQAKCPIGIWGKDHS